MSYSIDECLRQFASSTTYSLNIAMNYRLLWNHELWSKHNAIDYVYTSKVIIFAY
jgi:hypothetical protein